MFGVVWLRRFSLSLQLTSGTLYAVSIDLVGGVERPNLGSKTEIMISLPSFLVVENAWSYLIAKIQLIPSADQWYSVCRFN